MSRPSLFCELRRPLAAHGNIPLGHGLEVITASTAGEALGFCSPAQNGAIHASIAHFFLGKDACSVECR